MRSRIIAAGVCAAALLLFGQQYSSGPQVLTFLSDVDDSDQPYAVYVPPGYSADKPWPLVISLHGADSNHRLNMRRVFGRGNRMGESDLAASRFFPDLGSVDFLVASPLARGTIGYQGLGEKDVLDVLADMKRRFRVDDSRVYLTGLSLGGGGALWLGLTRPDLWAAVAAVCPAVPEHLEPLAGNALNLPIRLYQGEMDPLVPASQTRAWHQRLLDAGVKAEYTEYRQVRHNAWDFAYRDRAVFDWFRQFRRVEKPDRVHLASDSYARGAAYWLRFTELTPGTLASASAEFSADHRRLEVRTKSLDGFALTPERLPARPLEVVIDGGPPIHPRPGRGLLAFRRGPGNRWAAATTAQPAANSKHAGAEGPIDDALAARHVYIYGTEDAPGPEEALQRREIAKHAATWGTDRAPLLLNLRVLSDREAREPDLAGANLYLIGNRLTNGRIASIARWLPMHLNPGAADYGLLYVYPVNGRYVVIQSGLPWWTRLDQTRREGLRWVPLPLRTLQSFGDFVLFRGGLDNVIAEGRFDNQWRLPPDAAAKIRATGAVEIP